MSKEFTERLCELEEKYESVNEFDFITILKLEDEYKQLLENNPEHTKRRSETLEMRRRLLDRMRNKPKPEKKDMYVDTNKDKCTIFFNGAIYPLSANRFDSTSDMINHTANFLKSQSDNNIYVDTNGYGAMLADALIEKEVKYNKMKIERM